MIKTQFLFLITIVILLSCIKKEEHITLNIKPYHQIQLDPVFGKFANENKLDYYCDNLEAYITSINYDDNKNLELVLQEIYLRDQQYRDSLHTRENITEGQRVYFRKMFSLCDQINIEIVKDIFKNAGWPDTRKMNEDAQNGIRYTIHHSSDNTFNETAKTYTEQAFEESIISAQVYAMLSDIISVRKREKQIYGEYPYFYQKNGIKEIPVRASISIDSMNYRRSLIGLQPYPDSLLSY